jgi:hypothetical protein
MQAHTFDQDLLELKPFSKRLWQFIEVEHNFVDGSLVVGLSSKYGSGKSTFLRMWQQDLEENPPATGPVLVVPLNAWESDYFGDPLFAIVSSLVGRIRQTGAEPKPIVSAAKDIGWFATALVGQMVTKFTGVDAVAAGDLAEKKKAAREAPQVLPNDDFSMYEARKVAMAGLKAAIENFIKDSQSRILFLVDELDRCRPDYAIAYLETIKHIFDIPSATFILAADRRHLKNSAKTAFGPDLDFEEYYRKFIHREVTLPFPSEHSFRRISRAYAVNYLEREGLRLCIMKNDSNHIENIATLAAGLRLTPRQIQDAYRVLGHLMTINDQERRGQLYGGLASGSLVMALLKVGRPDVFELLGSQTFEPETAYKFITETMPKEPADWWLTLFATGGGLKLTEGEDLFEVFKRLKLTEEQYKDAWKSDLQYWSSAWGYGHRARFPEIMEKIDQVMQWS